MDTPKITEQEKRQILENFSQIKVAASNILQPEDGEKLLRIIEESIEGGYVQANIFGLNPILFGLQTAQITIDEIGLTREGVLAQAGYVVLIVLLQCWMRRAEGRHSRPATAAA